MQVPTYAKYLRDILSNKKPLPKTEVIKLTEECSEVILNKFPKKKKDPGCPTIDCTIRTQHFEHALCDLGPNVNVMPKVIFDKLNHTTLSPTSIYLQLADQSIRHPAGVAENIPVKIHDFLVPMDFVVLVMEVDKKVPLILGRPFLSTAKAHINVGACGGINPYTLTARLGPGGLAHYETSSRFDPTAWSFAQGNKTWRSTRILVG